METNAGRGTQLSRAGTYPWRYSSLGGGFHLFAPTPDGSFDPIDAEPSSITDFNGFLGLAYISGTVRRTNTVTGEVLTLPFVNSDMRFMKGVFRGTDGQIHQGAFAFVWVDVYEPGQGAQIHDLNPSTFPPTGLFWTIEIPGDGIQVHLGKGFASMEANNVPILDYGDIGNALFGGGPSPTPGQVSFRVTWSGVGERVNIRNEDPVYGGFAGNFIHKIAQMEWAATAGDFTFVSAPLGTSSSSFAEIGKERNSSFFP
jgi:hypothetical protein